MLQPAKWSRLYFCMLINWFWSNSIINQAMQEHYINLQMDLLENSLNTSLIVTGWEMYIKRFPKWRLGYIYNMDSVFGHCSVQTETCSQRGGPEQMLILVEARRSMSWLVCIPARKMILYNWEAKLRKNGGPMMESVAKVVSRKRGPVGSKM